MTRNLSAQIPDLALIGAMKSATTSLVNLLSYSPDICVATYKEPGFFSRDDRWNRGYDWYRRQFSHQRPHQKLCDASTCYSRSKKYPRAASRLHSVSPTALLVYILRDPVERSYSHYCHEMERRFASGGELVPLMTFLNDDPECLSASFYDEEIDHLLRVFRREQLICIRFEDFVTNPVAIANHILWSLGASPLPVIVKPQHLNQRASKVAALLAQSLEGRLRALWSGSHETLNVPEKRGLTTWPIVSSLLHASRLDLVVQRRFLSKIDPLTADVRDWLHHALDPHTKRLEHMLAWDLSKWLAT
jgi:hypothetical protein